MKYNNEKTLPARTDTMTRGTKPKKQKETSANRAKQIEATVHFWSKAFVQGDPRKVIRSPV